MIVHIIYTFNPLDSYVTLEMTIQISCKNLEIVLKIETLQKINNIIIIMSKYFKSIKFCYYTLNLYLIYLKIYTSGRATTLEANRVERVELRTTGNENGLASRKRPNEKQ